MPPRHEQASCLWNYIRNAVSIGGDSDTITAITGGMAGAFYGITPLLRQQTLARLPQHLALIVAEFEDKYGCNIQPSTNKN